MDNPIVMDLESMLIDESAEPRALPLSLLDEITGGFSQINIIGSGGFAVVYEGILLNGSVAVKKLTSTHLHENEFQREVACLMSVKHKNIVRFLGYCADTQGSVLMHNKRHVLAEVQSRLLCFEFLPKGSLCKHIKDASSGLPWRRRYRIIRSICEGLNYLHKNQIFHLDLKPANILMDENMEAKIADFGLARCLDEEQSKLMATKVVGTIGYMPPEFQSRIITQAYDIYSLGVIIIEILTGARGYHSTEDVLDSWKNRMEESHEACDLEQIRVCTDIGNECIESNPVKRPCSVQDIIDRLDETESADESSEEQMIPSMPTERGLLHVHQCQLRFPLFEPDKHVSSQLRLTNNTNDRIAFRCIPKPPESFIGGLLKLNDVMPPRSTRTFLVQMEKQPPENIEAFDVILESCVVHIHTNDVDANFLPEIIEVGGKVHQVPLVAVCKPSGEPIQSKTKIIFRTSHQRLVCSMDVHPTETWVFAGLIDGYVAVWNYQTQKRMVELEISQGCLLHACLLVTREDWCVLGDGHGVIHVRSCKTLELDQVKKFKAHDTWILALAVHPSLPLLLSGCIGNLIKLWDWEKDWMCVRTFRGHQDRVEALKFNPQDDGHDRITFVSASLDGKANIWDISKSIPIAMLDCKPEQLNDVDYYFPNDNEKYIITGGSGAKARIWDLRTHKCIRVIRGTMTNPVCCKVRVVHCPPDPPLLIKILGDSSVALCNSTASRIKNTIDFRIGHVRNMVYIKGIRSVVIGFIYGVAMLEID